MAFGRQNTRHPNHRAGLLISRLAVFSASLIKGVHNILDPFMLHSCRFVPSCSSYAQEALNAHGFLQGSWLIIKRLARCRPFGPRGFDPVP